MRVALELKDFSKYPFLKESQQFIGKDADSVEQFLRSNAGKIALKHAMERIRASLRTSDRCPDLPADRLGVKISVSGYVLARIIVSCASDRAWWNAWYGTKHSGLTIFFSMKMREKKDSSLEVSDWIFTDPPSRQSSILRLLQVCMRSGGGW
jgi:hypothetical protein